MQIKIQKTTTPKQKPDWKNLGFGHIFTDHMFIMDYDEGQGWHDARVVPYQPLVLDPSALVFHYAQECFEGLKAYRLADGSVQLFRPDKNAERMQSTHDRLCIPQIPVADFVDAVKALVSVDKDWVPSEPDTSLYIRPFTIATEGVLGVKASASYQFIIICSPSGAYYAEGLNPVKIYVEEVGAMNIMFKLNGEIYTAATSGTVLPGITRMSCIEVLKNCGYKVNEGKLAIDTVMEAGKNGTLEEVFGTGTAAVISPVGSLRYKDDVVEINNFEIGELTQRLYDTLTGIQYGKIEDTFGWTVKVD